MGEVEPRRDEWSGGGAAAGGGVFGLALPPRTALIGVWGFSSPAFKLLCLQSPLPPT